MREREREKDTFVGRVVTLQQHHKARVRGSVRQMAANTCSHTEWVSPCSQVAGCPPTHRLGKHPLCSPLGGGGGGGAFKSASTLRTDDPCVPCKEYETLQSEDGQERKITHSEYSHSLGRSPWKTHNAFEILISAVRTGKISFFLSSPVCVGSTDAKWKCPFSHSMKGCAAALSIGMEALLFN